MRWGLVLLGVLCVSCAFDPLRHKRPTRFTAGATVHNFASATPQPVVARTTTTTPETPTLPHRSTGLSFQFSQVLLDHLYVGVEAEAGELEAPGSNVAGGFGLVGVEGSSRLGGLGVEVAGGWRSLRYRVGGDAMVNSIVEPRVRGFLWLSSQITLGAAAGVTIGDPGWMAGAYVAVHSNLFDAFKR